jgi:type IV fimbrial biogenesis protein FimT
VKRPTAHPRRDAARRGGFTLIEALVAVAAVALLAAIALPSFAALFEKHRLRGAAEALAGDLAGARLEAARRGAALHARVQAGEAGCWGVATVPGCDCTQKAACHWRQARASAWGGVRVVQGAEWLVAADGSVGSAHGAGAGVELAAEPGAGRLRVVFSPLGRTLVCTPADAPADPDAPRC